MRTSPAPVPAAQYLRMSTDMQECSIENQAVVIQRYADANGFKILKTYEDAGKSGLTISQRKGLQSLLSDVLQHRAVFRAVLVYDVSRWGRFQDADEAAHYEFLCKSSGVKVHYCAEQFGPEETLPGRIMKALKRTMAAEFSRELSQRVFIGKKRRAQMGFHQGAQAGYALRRVLVGADGTAKQVLRSGELKSISSDHVVLVPGPEREQKWVRWIYEQRIHGLQICDIVKELNLRKVPWIDGKPWNRYAVRQVLTNHKYAGWSCWAQRSQTLRTKPRLNPREQWVLVEGAFKGIVDQATFDRAQRVIRQRLNYKSDEVVLRELKSAVEATRHAVRVHHRLMRGESRPSAGCDTVSATWRRFTNCSGLTQPQSMPSGQRKRSACCGCVHRYLLPFVRAFRTRSRSHGRVRGIGIASRLQMSVKSLSFCAVHSKRPEGLRYWMMNARAAPRNLPALVCLLSRDNESIEAYYVMPKIDAVSRMTLTPKDPWFQSGIRLESLTELHSALIEVKRVGSTRDRVSRFLELVRTAYGPTKPQPHT